MTTTEHRLQVLERDFQRSRRANRLLICLLGLAFMAGARGKTQQSAKPPTPKAVPPADARGPAERRDRLRTVEAEQFVLRDEGGRMRMKIDMTNGGPAISLFDENGGKRVELAHTDASSGVHLLDSDETPVVTLELPRDVGRGRLEIRNSHGSSMVRADGFSVLDTENNGRVHLALLNGNFPTLGISQGGQTGPPSIEMTASGGSRSVKIHDDDGRTLFSVFAADDGKTSVNMRHPDHARSLQISTGPNREDGPAIGFFGPAQKHGSGGMLPFLRLGLHDDQRPYIRIVDENGRTRFTVPTE